MPGLTMIRLLRLFQTFKDALGKERMLAGYGQVRLQPGKDDSISFCDID